MEFQIEPAESEEEAKSDTPEEYVRLLSRNKAAEVASRHAKEQVLVIGADTIVVCDGQILGKPKDREDAAWMLHLLSGRTHQVYTGVSCIVSDGSAFGEFSFSECTDVEMYELSDVEIEEYLDTPEPYDKAGAYAIQGRSAVFIRRICGDYYNVVGLPIGKLMWELKMNTCYFAESIL
jgi:septum formation protein